MSSQIAALRGAGYPDRVMTGTAAAFAVSIFWPNGRLGELSAALATAGLSYLLMTAVMLCLLQLTAKRDLVRVAGVVHVVARALAVVVLAPLIWWSPAEPRLAATAMIAAPICGVVLAIAALWFHRKRVAPQNESHDCAVE